jgi:hypothetical protein
MWSEFNKNKKVAWKKTNFFHKLFRLKANIIRAT